VKGKVRKKIEDEPKEKGGTNKKEIKKYWQFKMDG
jgi:hypothetical protein